jgi:large subunit ribosomal protein L25
MSQTVNITAASRDRAGKGAARAIRREGRVPGVIYGDKKDPQLVSLEYRELMKQVQTGRFLSTLVDIDVDGTKVRAIPRDVQFDPVRDFIIHVDFLRLGKGAKIAVQVPVHFVNEDASKGLKRGGVLNVVRHEVEVNCPADEIPDFFEIDLAGLDIGDSIHASSVTLPEHVTFTITDRDFTIATIAAPSGGAAGGEEGEAEAAEAEGEEAAAEEEGGES